MARSTAGVPRPALAVGGLLGAAVLALAGCGSDRGGSVALGDGGPAPALTAPSNSGVVFVPLDRPTPGRTAPPGSSHPVTPGATRPGAPGTGGGSGNGSGTPRSGGPPGTPGAGGGTGGAGSGGTSGGSTTGGSGSPTPTPGGGSGGGTGTGGGSGGTQQTPAQLTVTALTTADTAQRWCQRVTLTLANSGDRTATGGTVTFATHVIGALGVDWWTYETSQPLAAPVAGHASTHESWTVCLDSWRVPAGMHLETRAATLG